MIGCDRVDAEWIMDKRDWKEAQRREKAAEKTPLDAGGNVSSSSGTQTPDSSVGDTSETNAYRPEMDEMRCLLWAHGGQWLLVFGLTRVLTILFCVGGYYFGSVDQERYDDAIAIRYACSSLVCRYMIQRYARKMHGRVFGERNVCGCSCIDRSFLHNSAEISTGTSISLPLRSARPAGVVCVP